MKFCVKCGNKLRMEANFCSKCGEKLDGEKLTKEIVKKETKSFHDSSLILANPQKLALEINEWLINFDGIRNVKARHQVSQGRVKNIEVTVYYSGEIEEVAVFHQVDVCSYNLGGIFALSTAGKEDFYKEKWQKENPDKKLLYCFNVFDYGRMREQWFYYKEKYRVKK